MKKLQNVYLITIILFSIYHAIHILLGFQISFSIMRIVWIQKVFAFWIGVCGFLSILSFNSKD